MPDQQGLAGVTVTFAGSGDAFGSGGRFQACIHLRPAGPPPAGPVLVDCGPPPAGPVLLDCGPPPAGPVLLDCGPPPADPVLLDCGATSLPALRRCGLDPGGIAAVFLSHLHGDHFGGLPFLILDGQFIGRTTPLAVVGPAGTGRRLSQAMEGMFPGSSRVPRRFAVEVTELRPGAPAGVVAGVRTRAFPASHPSGAPALILRLALGGRVIAYTGDTAWTPAIAEAAAGADLLIAEAYYWDKAVPHHLRHADLAAHRDELTARRTVLTHMSADMLRHLEQARFETAHDGLVLPL